MGFTVSDSLFKRFQIQLEYLGLFGLEFILKTLYEYFLADNTGRTDESTDDDRVGYLYRAKLQRNIVDGNSKNFHIIPVGFRFDSA